MGQWNNPECSYKRVGIYMAWETYTLQSTRNTSWFLSKMLIFVFVTYALQVVSSDFKLAFLFSSLQKNSKLGEQKGDYLQDSFRLNTLIPFTEEIIKSLQQIENRFNTNDSYSFIIRFPSKINDIHFLSNF